VADFSCRRCARCLAIVFLLTHRSADRDSGRLLAQFLTRVMTCVRIGVAWPLCPFMPITVEPSLQFAIIFVALEHCEMLNARVEPGSKIAPLQPFPTDVTSIRNPLYSRVVIVFRMIATARGVMPECSRAECYWKCRTASIIFRAL
jgi:hypothetical protein